MPIPPPRRPMPDHPSDPDGASDAEGSGRTVLPEPREGAPPPPQLKPRRRIANAILQVLAVVVVISSLLLLMLWEGDKLPNDPGEISRLRSLARLNPLPKEATNIKLLQPGESDDALSNIFGITFQAPELAVLTWISQSPGTQELKSEYVARGVVRYVIPLKPRDGKPTQAEVIWQKDQNKVWISLPPEALQGD